MELEGHYKGRPDSQRKEGKKMADADGRMIPYTEDDQGEGIKDFYDEMHPATQLEMLHKEFERHNKTKEPKPELIESLIEMVFALNSKIDFIFDGHVLINGRFQKPKI